MTNILQGGAVENAKWRAQADKIAVELKRQPPKRSGMLKIGIVFDDALAKVEIDASLIGTLSNKQLADHVYNLVLTHAQTGGTA